MKYEIEDKLRDVRVFFRNIVIGIKNIITWFPVIWNDRQWDHVYMFDILQKKFTEMHKFWSSDKPITEKEHIIKDIETCIEIIDRLQNDNYCDDLHTEHNEKWGKVSFTFEPTYDKNGNISDKFCRIMGTRVFADNPEKIEQERQEFLWIMREEEREREKDINLLFDIMKHKIQFWWD